MEGNNYREGTKSMENDFGGRRAGLPVYAHYQLIIDELTRQRPLAAPSVLKFSSEEHLSRPWRYVLEFTSPLAALPASAIVNQPAFNRPCFSKKLL